LFFYLMERSVSTLFQSLPDPVLVSDVGGRVKYANPAAQEWFALPCSVEDFPALDEILTVAAGQAADALAGMWDALARDQGWTGYLTVAHPRFGQRELRVRAMRLESANEASHIYVQCQDLSDELERMRAEAAHERANLMLDLLGSTASELGSAVGSLRWAAGLPDHSLSSLPADLRSPMLEMRGCARRLHDLFRHLYENLPAPPDEPNGTPSITGAMVGGSPISLLVADAPPVEAARLIDEVRRAEVGCAIRTTQNREQTMRAALSGEVDAVLLGSGFAREEARDLVKALSQKAPQVAVFDPQGVEIDVLIQGIRGAVRERRRKDRAKETWRSIEEIALRDPLTSTLNRRALERFGRLEFARAERYSFPLALAIFDMDHFKGLNDELGHAAGDRALQLFSSALQAGVREMDLVARLGGDEFVVLMPHTDPAGALTTVQRLRSSAESLLRERIPEASRAPGASAGFSVFPDSGVGNFEDLLARADEALYRAKRERRRTRKRSMRKAVRQSDSS